MALDLRKAAERILATERLEDVTIRRLTREVGVAPANFYNHYAGLDELLFSIAASGFDELRELALPIFAREGSKPDLLVAVAKECIGFCIRNRQLARLMFRRADGHQYDRYPVATNRAFGEAIRFIYGEEAAKDALPAGGTHERFGVAFGFFALWYGVASIAAEGLFSLDPDDDAALTNFLDHVVRPFFNGSAARVITLAEAADHPASGNH